MLPYQMHSGNESKESLHGGITNRNRGKGSQIVGSYSKSFNNNYGFSKLILPGDRQEELNISENVGAKKN